jgi:uridylate kinase
MAGASRYKRVLIKLSGESFCTAGGFGLAPGAVAALVDRLAPIIDMGVELGLVVGGGNFIRGRALTDHADSGVRIERTTADHMGMLATVINALALQAGLESRGVSARVLSAIPMTAICEPFSPRRALHHLSSGRVVIFAGGTGSPFFTTDTCAALRAREIGAEVLIKATKVDGVFDADPLTHPAAKRYDRLSYRQILDERLGVMDLTAISMCMESGIPILVIELSKAGNLTAALAGEPVGTLVTQ